MTTWTPATSQAETWTEISQRPVRTFSVLTFSRLTFDVGTPAGIWDAQIKQSEAWTPE